MEKEMRKSNIIYSCGVCGKQKKGRKDGVICKFCKKYVMLECGCYGDFNNKRKCCGKEE